MSETRSPDWPLGLSREQAAIFVGLSAGTFDKHVREGVFPAPVHFGRRLVWHRRSLEEAMDRAFGRDKRRNEGPSLGDIQW